MAAAITSINYERYLPPQIYDTSHSAADNIEFVLDNDATTSTFVLNGYKIVLCIADKSLLVPVNPVL